MSDAEKCAALFKKHAEEIDGVLVTLPNFGDERAVANAIRWSGLDVPVLVQATPDDMTKMTVADRRDSFCGKMSVCNNLRQYGIKYSLTSLHTVAPGKRRASGRPARNSSASAAWCAACKVRASALIGARPANFITVRFSEKLFERAGISVETIDLSEIFGKALKLAANDAKVKAKVEQIRAYVPVRDTPAEALVKMAQLGVVIDDWMAANKLSASAIQCWTAMEEFYGVVPCTIMSMMSNNLVPSACETDIAGVVGMYAMALASGKPSALVDWNNNYGEDPDKCVIFHCSNLPKDVFAPAPIKPDDIMVMDYQAIIAGTVGKENTFGTVVGRVKADAVHLLPRLDRRLHRPHPGLPGRGRADQRSARHLRRLRRRAHPEPPEAAALHLRERLRAPHRDQPVPGRRRGERGVGEVYGVGSVPPQVIEC